MSIAALNRVTKQFGAQAVLTRASLAVGHHAKIGLVGANGSGKSTVLKLLSGETQPDAGDVAVAGHAECEADELRVVRADEFGERIAVASPGSRDQFAGDAVGLAGSLVSHRGLQRTPRAHARRAPMASGTGF